MVTLCAECQATAAGALMGLSHRGQGVNVRHLQSDGSCIELIPRSKDWFEPGCRNFGISNSSAQCAAKPGTTWPCFGVGGNPPQYLRGTHVA